MHLGETATFTGEYLSDHEERSYVWPHGCDHSILLGQVSPEADKILDRAETLPRGRIWDDRTLKRTVEATFTGTLVQVEPDGITGSDYALNISNITDLKISDPD
jgi:hypothetical protein